MSSFTECQYNTHVIIILCSKAENEMLLAKRDGWQMVAKKRRETQKLSYTHDSQLCGYCLVPCTNKSIVYLSGLALKCLR